MSGVYRFEVPGFVPGDPGDGYLLDGLVVPDRVPVAWEQSYGHTVDVAVGGLVTDDAGRVFADVRFVDTPEADMARQAAEAGEVEMAPPEVEEKTRLLRSGLPGSTGWRAISGSLITEGTLTGLVLMAGGGGRLVARPGDAADGLDPREPPQFSKSLDPADWPSHWFRISTEAIDKQGDVVSQRGLDFTEFRSNPQVFLAHQYLLPVATARNPATGAVEIRQDFDRGETYGRAFLHLRTEESRLTWDLVKAGVLSGASVGIVVDKGDTEPRKTAGGRRYNYVKRAVVTEFSICALPANAEALSCDAVRCSPVIREALAAWPDDGKAKADRGCGPDCGCRACRAGVKGVVWDIEPDSPDDVSEDDVLLNSPPYDEAAELLAPANARRLAAVESAWAAAACGLRDIRQALYRLTGRR
jgi:hypothetical protein